MIRCIVSRVFLHFCTNNHHQCEHQMRKQRFILRKLLLLYLFICDLQSNKTNHYAYKRIKKSKTIVRLRVCHKNSFTNSQFHWILTFEELCLRCHPSHQRLLWERESLGVRGDLLQLPQLGQHRGHHRKN